MCSEDITEEPGYTGRLQQRLGGRDGKTLLSVGETGYSFNLSLRSNAFKLGRKSCPGSSEPWALCGQLV